MQNAFDIEIRISRGEHEMQTRWTAAPAITFGKLAAELSEPVIGRKSGTCYVPGTFTGTSRKKDETSQISVAVLDADCGHERGEIVAALRGCGYAAFVHSTHSHLTDETQIAVTHYDKWRKADGADFSDAEAPAAYMGEKKGYLPHVIKGARIAGKATGRDGDKYVIKHQPCHKFRILIPLVKPWIAADFGDTTARAADWKGRILALATRLHLFHDQSCSDTSRLFYMSRVKDAAALDAFEREPVEGEALNIHTIAPIMEAPSAPKRTRAAPHQHDAEERAPRPRSSGKSKPADLVFKGVNLVEWMRGVGRGFEIRTALQTRGKAPFGPRIGGATKHHFLCAFDEEHTQGGDRTGTFAINASERGQAGLPSIKAPGPVIMCKHNACTGRDRLVFILRMLELEWLTVEDLTDARFLTKPEQPALELPPNAAPARTGEHAGRTVRRLTKRFCRAVKTHVKAQKFRKAEFERLRAEADPDSLSQDEARRTLAKLAGRVRSESRRRFGTAKRPSYAIAAAAGTGKTSAFIECYRDDPEMWELHIRIAEQTRDMCVEVRDKLNGKAPEGMPQARTIAGREAKGMCEFPTIAHKIGPHVKSTFKAMCNSGTSKCPDFDSCGYNSQFTEPSAHEPRIYVVTHARLRSGQPAEIALPEPDLVVVDESAVSSLTRTREVNPEAFGVEAAYHGRAGDEMMAPVYADVGRHIAAIIMTGGNVLKRVKEEIPAESPDALVERVGEAAAAAARCFSRNGGISPGVVEDEAMRRLERLKKSESEGISLVLATLARDLQAGVCLAVQWRPAGTDDWGNERAGRILHHGRLTPVAIGKAALLLLDADAVPEVNRILFAREIKTFRVEAIRLAKFTQCHNNEFSKATLIPLNINADRHARAETLLSSLYEFARSKCADGRKTLIVTNRPVHIALRVLAGMKGEPNDGLPKSSDLAPGLEVTHFGAYTGRDSWRCFDSVIVIGREQPRPEGVEALARCVYGDMPRIEMELTGKYVKAWRKYSTDGDAGAELRTHADPRVRALLELMRERMSVQGIDRLRLIHARPDGRQPDVFVFCSIPLPGIAPDVLATTNVLLAGGTRIERAIASGFVTRNATVMYKEFGYVSLEAARHDIKDNTAAISQAIENEANGRNAIDSNICNLANCLEINHLAGGDFRHRRPGAVPPVWSGFGYDPQRPGRRRIDITLARHHGAKHVNEIEFRGHAADALERSRGMDHKLNRMPSLAVYDTKTTPLNSRKFFENVFAMSPTRVTRRMPDGTIVETWRTHDGKPIPAPIDAPPAPPAPPPVPTGMARIVDTDADGKTSVEWINVPASVGAQRIAALLAVRAAHRARILAMNDDEILAAVADSVSTSAEQRARLAGTEDADGVAAERARLAHRIRAYAAVSPAHAAKVFLPGRWTPATATPPATPVIA